jgi:hypothetical protein
MLRSEQLIDHVRRDTRAVGQQLQHLLRRWPQFSQARFVLLISSEKVPTHRLKRDPGALAA